MKRTTRLTWNPWSLAAIALTTSACLFEVPELVSGHDLAAATTDDMGTGDSGCGAPVESTAGESQTTTGEPEPSTGAGEPTSMCGDEMVEGSEQCDGPDLDDQSCLTRGYDAGNLSCTGDCTFDESGCTNVGCGNDLVEGAEVCDGSALEGKTCVDVGFDAGVLGCQPDCAGFDTSGCILFSCGNDVIEGMEVCDGSDLSGEECVNVGFDAGVLGCQPGCQAYDTSGCMMWSCGNDMVEGTEVCDGSELSGQDCQSQGFDYGDLNCRDNCFGYDTSECGYFQGDCCSAHDDPGCDHVPCMAQVCALEPSCCEQGWDPMCAEKALGLCPYVCTTCGDDDINGISEVCDGADLGGKDCTTEGFASGTLACATDCSGLDVSGCSTCGDGMVDGVDVCDGDDLGGKDCISLGFAGGTLSCTDGCYLDTSGCIDHEGGDCCYDNDDPGCEVTPVEACVCAIDEMCCELVWDDVCAMLADEECKAHCGGCGNGIVDQAGEACDEDDLKGQSCAHLGFDGGTLGCASDCSGFDVSGCHVCGNDVIEAGERCDDADLGGEDCISQGFDGGVLTCLSDCSDWDRSGCVTEAGD
ncbi:MAG: hypothetical protein AAGF11_43085 [Myxococcota bacterium]